MDTLTSTPADAVPPAVRRPFLLAAIVAASFMIAIEATIVATAMPQIVGQHLYSWVFSSFLLAQTATMVVFGKLADLSGRRSVLLVGIGSCLKQRDPDMRSACCESARMTVQQFKALPHQAVAAEAVVDCLEGQPRIEGLSYQINPGRDTAAQELLLGGEGLHNADLRLSAAQLACSSR